MRLAGPFGLDLLPAQIAFSATDQAAFGFAVIDQDHSADSKAFALQRAPSGKRSGTRRVAATKQVLDLAFAGSTLEVLAGTSGGGPCCTSAQVLSWSARGFAKRHTLVRALGGATVGRLLPLGGKRMLAVIGSGSGVWVAQSDAAGRFAGAHRLTSGSSTPQSVAATALSAGRSSVAWIAASAGGAATKILDAGGSLAHAPAHPHVAVRVPPGHEVDELALGPGPRGPTAGWVESWYDSAGSFHSEVAAADLAGRVRGRAFALAGQLAADVAVASDARGDSLLVWKACDRNAACAVYGASRAAGARFGAPQRLGAVDASQEPAAAIGARGQAIAGWIDNGHVFAAARGTARGRFGSPALVSGTNFAADLNLAFGPRGETIATWTQGTLAPSLMAAVHR